MALNTPPSPGTYQFVLRTIRPYDPELCRTAYTYDEVQESRDITHPDGVRHPTVFVWTQTARDKLVMDGWADVSEQWFALHGRGEPEAPKPPVRRVSIKA